MAEKNEEKKNDMPPPPKEDPRDPRDPRNMTRGRTDDVARARNAPMVMPSADDIADMRRGLMRQGLDEAGANKVVDTMVAETIRSAASKGVEIDDGPKVKLAVRTPLAEGFRRAGFHFTREWQIAEVTEATRKLFEEAPDLAVVDFNEGKHGKLSPATYTGQAHNIVASIAAARRAIRTENGGVDAGMIDSKGEPTRGAFTTKDTAIGEAPPAEGPRPPSGEDRGERRKT